MAAIIDQCSGQKATKVIAKRRVEMIEGNVYSYARILNGPQQLERIKTFNDLSASIATLQREKQAADEEAKKKKKEGQADKTAEKKAEQERIAKEEHGKLAPDCEADVAKGIDHVLTLTNPRRKLILKIHFDHTSGLSKMLLKDTESELRKYMEAPKDGNVNLSESGIMLEKMLVLQLLCLLCLVCLVCMLLSQLLNKTMAMYMAAMNVD